MHAAKITNDNNAARLYRFMARLSGQWLDAWELSQEFRTMALSTRISEIRQQLPPNERIEYKYHVVKGKRHGYYRLVVS